MIRFLQSSVSRFRKQAIFIASLVAIFAGSALPACAQDYSNWAVLIVVGSDVSSNGDYIPVFDNTRRDLTKELSKIGFDPANIHQLSVRPDASARPATINAIAGELSRATRTATGGCMVYMTSHGAQNAGLVIGNTVLTPKEFSAMVDAFCGNRPSMIVMSGCYTGQFVVPLINDYRLILTAARSTKMSWDCTDPAVHNCFDGCFLNQLTRPWEHFDFAQVSQGTISCVNEREQRAGIPTPSEPRLYVGRQFGREPQVAMNRPGGAAMLR